MDDDARLDQSWQMDQVETALLSAVQRTRTEYEAASADERPIRRAAYAEALRAFNHYITRI
jgi:hypothetical protein